MEKKSSHWQVFNNTIKYTELFIIR